MNILSLSRKFKLNDNWAKYGLTLISNPYSRTLTEEEVIDLANDNIVGMIVGLEPITDTVLSHLKNLRIIIRYGAGTDNVDLEAVKRLNIKFCNIPNIPTNATAEHTMMLILSALKRNRCCLEGKTVGIIGLGRIGKRLVQLLQPYHVKVLAYDPYIDLNYHYGWHAVKMVPLNVLIQKSDIVTLHCPLTDETYKMIGESVFSHMKDSAILVNTARSAIVAECELCVALKNKWISGAALDVWECDKLKELDNVILTPHIASDTIETREAMNTEVTNILIRELGLRSE